MLRSIASNAFCKPIRTIPVRKSESRPFVILSWWYDKQVSVEWKFLKPDWYLCRALLSDRKFIVWSWIIRSIILEISGSSEVGLKFFGSVLRPFLYKGLIFATFHLSGKEASLMERLQILATGVQSISEPSLRNHPARLSTSVALLVLNSFNIFRIDNELIFSNSSFFFTEISSLVILAHWRCSKFSSIFRKLLNKITCKIRKIFFVFAIALGENVNSFSVLRHMRVVEPFLSGEPNFFIIFQSSFGFPIFSDSFSCKIFFSCL